MSSHDLLIIVLFIGILVSFTPFFGKWLANVLQGKRTWLSPVLEPAERCVYRMAGVDPAREMDWKKYLAAVLLFNAAGFLVLFLSLLCQKWLPLNPAGTENMRWDIALNTAISFVTSTGWQFYSGEGPEGVSYFVQMTGLGVQNFVSAATGIAVMSALIRGLERRCASTLGNFWADLTRSTLYFLVPVSSAVALLLVSQGVVQSFDGPTAVPGMDGVAQMIPNGPAASQIAIKQLGTNGGGFFGNNSTHPFENPTPFSNMVEMLSLLLAGCACPYAYGVMIGKKRQGWIIFGAMMILLVAAICLSQWAEHAGNPLFPGMEMLEGKEARLGVTNSSLWSVATAASSNGSVNCMHSSMSPLGGGIALFNILLGEVIFGGLGSGLCGMLMFAMITVFLCGLMVGRTPEFLGKKLGAREVRWAMSGLAAAAEAGRASICNAGPHGLTEILYCFGSQAGNNGSAFAGLVVGGTPFYSLLGGLAMLLARFGTIISVMIIAGGMASKKNAPPAQGSMETDNLMFMVLLVAVVLVVGALTFFPALALGPILEHLLLYSGAML